MASPSVTLITCYYKVKSKHTFDEYAIWITNLLLTIKCNIIIFTSADQVEWINSLALQNRTNQEPDANLGGVKVIIKELQDLDIVKRYPDIWEYQYWKDPTRDIRTKECYMIWNSKLALVHEAIIQNPFGSDKFVWNDIGSLRDSKFIHENYIQMTRYPLYENISRDKIDIVLIDDFKVQNQIIFQNEIHLSGAIFGGGQEAFLKLIDLFYDNFNMYLEKGYFIGCDQQILATCFQQAPELFNLIIPDYSDRVIDKWFYLYYYYTQPFAQSFVQSFVQPPSRPDDIAS